MQRVVSRGVGSGVGPDVGGVVVGPDVGPRVGLSVGISVGRRVGAFELPLGLSLRCSPGTARSADAFASHCGVPWSVCVISVPRKRTPFALRAATARSRLKRARIQERRLPAAAIVDPSSQRVFRAAIISSRAAINRGAGIWGGFGGTK